MTARLTMRQLADAFADLVELPQDAREQWFETTVLDAQDRDRLRRMLRADADRATSLLDRPAAEHAVALEAPAERMIEPSDLIGRQVGAFRLLELLGQGGMASVFLAERVGADFDQRVAVKLLRRGLYSSVEQQLFRRERRVLAQLDHPNIARLIDGGVSDAGVPFLVMEHVHGLRLDDFVRERRLDVRQRLELFVQVCAGVEAAHRALVVHRDLKPSNILVTEAGVPKLLDFGIAKLLQDDPTGEQSRTLSAALTPGYASPEQFEGRPVTTASDIYALGIVLHELLTGARPSPRSYTAPSNTLRREAAEGAPLPLKALQRALRGDLDTIVMRALHPEPARRYPSVEALAADVRNHLDGRPVTAHPPSRLYFASRFVRRHRLAVGLTSLLSLMVLAALATALWQADAARNQARRATEVQHFLEAMFEPLESGNDNGNAPTLEELLGRGLQRLETEASSDPGVQADLLAMFARINDGIGEVRDNLLLAESAWKANVAAWGAEDRRSVEAQVVYGRVLRKAGRSREAYEQLEAARAALQRQGVGGILYAQVLDTQLNARMGIEHVNNDEAIALRREILRLREADPRATPDDIATGYNNLGRALEDARDYPGASAAYRRAYELRKAYLGDSAKAALSLGNVGNVASWQKHWHEAIAIFEEARAMYARAHIARHPNLAGLLTRLCDLRMRIEDFEGASADCEASLAMNGELVGTGNHLFGMAVVREASRALAAGENEAAIAGFRHARELFATNPVDGPDNVRTVDIAESTRWRLMGEWETLRDRLTPVADLPRYAEHWSAPLVYSSLALACAHAPAPGCETRLAQARMVLAKPLFEHDPMQLPAATSLARIALHQGDRRGAVQELQRALADVREIGPSHSWLGEAWLVLSQASDDPRTAREARRRAETIIGGLPPGHLLHARLAQAQNE